MKVTRIMKVMFVALVVTVLGLSASGAFAQSGSHTSSQFQGPKANKGTVTHSIKDGKSVLTLSDDFVVPDTPDPHWQVVDSDGNVYLLDKLKTKAFIGNNALSVTAVTSVAGKLRSFAEIFFVPFAEAAFAAGPT